jgi:acyl carrier protein
MKFNPIERAVHDFLVEDVFASRNVDSLRLDDSLFELELLDSIAIVKTVTFCEENFGILIPDEDVLPEHFESVRAIAKLVARRRSTRAGD